MSDQNSERNRGSRMVIVGLILVLLVINAILLYMQHQKTQQNEQQAEIIKTKTSELEEQIKTYEALKADFERQSQELQQLGGSNDSLRAQIAAITADLNQLRSFRKGSFSIADQKKYRERASNLEQQLKRKDEEIARLKEDNEQLFTENTDLKTTQTRLSDTVSTLKSNNQNLSQKVQLASRLNAEKINVSIINDRGKEKTDDDEEFRARQVDKLKVSFKLSRNDVAEKNSKDIYLRLIEPDGAALYNLSTGGGTFKVEGKDVPYTAKTNILFDNSGQSASFTYDKDAEYKKGVHTVELYSGGYQIGQTTFKLK
jgi:myosin heavy subunit